MREKCTFDVAPWGGDSSRKCSCFAGAPKLIILSTTMSSVPHTPQFQP